jgi:hypothetical protein
MEQTPAKKSKGSDKWEFFPCTMGDDQAFIFFNDGISGTIDDGAPGLLVRTELKYKQPGKNGLPTHAEFEDVSKIEDRLQQFADENGDWYVGRATVGGSRYFYVYTAQSEQSWTEFIQGLSTESGYEVKPKFRDDPKHKGYWDELYPTPADRQVIEDLRTLEAFRKRRDDSSVRRQIDHWAYFPSKAAASPFVQWATADDFTFHEDLSRTTDDGQYVVRLSHVGTLELADLTSHTIRLEKKAREFGGDYDGWEAPVEAGAKGPQE